MFTGVLWWQSDHAKLALSKISSVIIRELIPLNKQGSWCLLQGRRPLHMKELVARIIWCGTKRSHFPHCWIKWFQAWEFSILFQRFVLNTLLWKDSGRSSIIQSTITRSSTHDHNWKTPHLSPVCMKGTCAVSISKSKEILFQIEKMWANISSHLVRSVQTIPNMPNAQKRHWQAVHAARLVHRNCFPSECTN